jgi:hypothetical protein
MMDPFVIGIVLGPVVLIGGTWLAIKLFNRAERAAVEKVRRTGTPCTAFVKSYRRVSMTQHKVLFEIRLPSGPIGREYMLSGLSEAWLADAAALGRPVQVIAHPDAKTIALA